MNRNYVFATLLLASIAVAGCSIQSKHEDGSRKESVKIETPLGGMNVRTDKVEAKDAGMSVFPGNTGAEVQRLALAGRAAAQQKVMLNVLGHCGQATGLAHALGITQCQVDR